MEVKNPPEVVEDDAVVFAGVFEDDSDVHIHNNSESAEVMSPANTSHHIPPSTIRSPIYVIPKQFKGRLFGIKNNREKEPPPYGTGLGVAGPQGFDYELRYPEDGYGEETFPDARVFRVYNDEMAIVDLEKIEAWRDALDVLLVFIGLFSAIVTTFVVQISLRLQPDFVQINAITTFEILQAMVNASLSIPVTQNISDPRYAFAGPSRSDLWVNGLWFTSLAISLSTGLITTLTKQWLYHFTSTTSGTARERARIRQFRFAGLKAYRMPVIIELLPVALHLALALFMAGLAVFLSSLHMGIAMVVGTLSLVAYLFYFISIILPLRNPQCPYQSPLSAYIYPTKDLFTSLGRFATVITNMSSPIPARYVRRAVLVILDAATRFLSRGIAVITHSFVGPEKWTERYLGPIGPLAPKSLSEAERRAVHQHGEQLDIDSIAELYTRSSNSTVRSIALQSIGGLQPSDADITPLLGIIDSDLYHELKQSQVAQHNSKDPVVAEPLQGSEAVHDRLVRALWIADLGKGRPFEVHYTMEDSWLADSSFNVARCTILPFMSADPIDDIPLLERFGPLGDLVDLQLPPSLWALYLRLLEKHGPDNTTLKGFLLNLGLWKPGFCVPQGGDLKPMALRVALHQSQTLYDTALKFIGISLPENIEDQALSLLQALSDTLLQLPDYHTFISEQLRNTLAAQYSLSASCNEVVRHIAEILLTSQSWETVCITAQALTALQPEAVSEALAPSIIHAFFDRIESDHPVADWESVWTALDALDTLLPHCLSTQSLHLAETVCDRIRKLQQDRGISRFFWTESVCRTLVKRTLHLIGDVQADWMSNWVDYIHTPERLTHLCKTLIRVSDSDKNPLNNLCDIRPHDPNWPQSFHELLTLVEDEEFLASIISTRNPKQLVSLELSRIKRRLNLTLHLGIPRFSDSGLPIQGSPPASPQNTTSPINVITRTTGRNAATHVLLHSSSRSRWRRLRELLRVARLRHMLESDIELGPVNET